MYCGQLIGESFYEKTATVLCDCNSHIGQFFVYKDTDKNLFAGLSYYGWFAKSKSNYVDFWFVDTSKLYTLCDFLEYCYDSITDDKVTFINNGALVVEYDAEYGYLTFLRYKNDVPKKREKAVWDICLKSEHIPTLVDELRSLTKFIEEARKLDCCF